MTSMAIDNIEAGLARGELHKQEAEAKAYGVKPVDHSMQFHSVEHSKEEKELAVTDGDYIRPTEEERQTLRRVPEVSRRIFLADENVGIERMS